MNSNWTRRAFGVATAALIALAGCAGPGTKAAAGDPMPS
jgi:hypothetical protein